MGSGKTYLWGPFTKESSMLHQIDSNLLAHEKLDDLCREFTRKHTLIIIHFLFWNALSKCKLYRNWRGIIQWRALLFCPKPCLPDSFWLPTLWSSGHPMEFEQRRWTTQMFLRCCAYRLSQSIVGCVRVNWLHLTGESWQGIHIVTVDALKVPWNWSHTLL